MWHIQLTFMVSVQPSICLFCEQECAAAVLQWLPCGFRIQMKAAAGDYSADAGICLRI